MLNFVTKLGIILEICKKYAGNHAKENQICPVIITSKSLKVKKV